MHRIIGIAGPAGSGKDTVANYIMRKAAELSVYYDIEIESFAGPIKAMLMVGLHLTPAQLYGDAKEIIDERYGKSPREMMQTLGTEWGRVCVGSDVWLEALDSSLDGARPYVIPDVRFANEAEYVRDNGVLIHITGRNQGIGKEHASESGVNFEEGDINIVNDSDLLTFLDRIGEALHLPGGR